MQTSSEFVRVKSAAMPLSAGKTRVVNGYTSWGGVFVNIIALLLLLQAIAWEGIKVVVMYQSGSSTCGVCHSLTIIVVLHLMFEAVPDVSLVLCLLPDLLSHLLEACHRTLEKQTLDHIYCFGAYTLYSTLLLPKSVL